MTYLLVQVGTDKPEIKEFNCSKDLETFVRINYKDNCKVAITENCYLIHTKYEKKN